MNLRGGPHKSQCAIRNWESLPNLKYIKRKMGKFNTILESKRKTNILLFIYQPDENIRILTATVKTKF